MLLYKLTLRCSSWYPFLGKALKNKLQAVRNKSIRFCLEFPLLIHMSPTQFQKINWLLTEARVVLSITIFKCWKGIAPSSLNVMFMPSLNNYNATS